MNNSVQVVEAVHFAGMYPIKIMISKADVYPLPQSFAPPADADLSPASDFNLAHLAAAGDTSAFEQLYQRHFRRVFALCLRMTRNSAEAEDITQETFIQVFRHLAGFRREAAFTTWLHRLAVNQVLMHFRRRGVRLEQTTADGEVPEHRVAGRGAAGQVPVVERLALEDSIAQLPAGYRLIFILHDVEGYDHPEIARMVGCAVGTSKSQLHKARLRLRSLLSQNIAAP